MKRIITTLFVFVIAIGVFAPVTFSLAPQNNFVQTQVAHAQQATTTALQEVSNGCGVFSGTIGNCISYIFYFIPYAVGGTVLTASAYFLDITASLTLSSSLFTSSSFIQIGWALMRDIANVFFILMLLYIALLIMIDEPMQGGGSPKKMIWSVILMAIVINFSMFITGIVIDTSNTLALVFYNQISVKSEKLSTIPNNPAEQAAASKLVGSNIKTVEPKQISLSLASAFHPQAFEDPAFWKKLQNPGDNYVGAGTMIPLLLMMGTLFFVVAWSFFVAGFSFLGRMVELFIIVIFSPIAFVSYIVPGLKGMERLGWTDWWKRLSDVAFSAPLYFMMLYLIALILDQGLFGGQNHTVSSNISAGTWLMTIVTDVMIPAIFLFIMLSMATKFVMKASGAIGSALGGAANLGAKALGGAALGAALGGGAALGRTAGGRLGERLEKSNWVQNNKTNTGISGWVARQGLKTGKGMQTASYDVRQTAAGRGFSNFTGMSLESYGTLSTKAAAGGRVNQKARQQLKQEKLAALIGHDEKGKKKIDHEIEHKQADADKKKIEVDENKERFEAVEKEQTAAKAVLEQANKDLRAAKNLLVQAQASGNLTAIAEAQTMYNTALADVGVASAPARPAVIGQNGQIITPAQPAQRATGKNLALEEAKSRLAPVKIAYEDSKAELKQLETGRAPERYSSDRNHNDYNPANPNSVPFDPAKVGKVMRRNGIGKITDDGSGKVNYTAPLSTHTVITDPVTHQKTRVANINPATGNPVTRDEVIKSQGIEGLKKLSEQTKTAQSKEYLFKRMAKRYNVDEAKDVIRNAAGDVTAVHFDPKKELRQDKTKGWQAVQNVASTISTSTVGLTVSAALTLIPVVGIPLAVAALAATGAAVGSNVKSGLKTTGTVADTQIEALTGAAHNVDGGHQTHVAESTAPGKQLHENIGEAIGSVPGEIGKGFGAGGGGGGGAKPAKAAASADHGHH
ncbi:MAG: hypothetical protein WCO65_03035 [bacterium]